MTLGKGALSERGNREWTWRELPVDSSAEHIELRHGDASKEAYEQWMPLALIGPPRGRVFPVHWLGGPTVTREMRVDAERELTFYLVEKREPSPWRYAVYHCGTAPRTCTPRSIGHTYPLVLRVTGTQAQLWSFPRKRPPTCLVTHVKGKDQSEGTPSPVNSISIIATF